jgi:hypothetical protein
VQLCQVYGSGIGVKRANEAFYPPLMHQRVQDYQQGKAFPWCWPRPAVDVGHDREAERLLGRILVVNLANLFPLLLRVIVPVVLLPRFS